MPTLTNRVVAPLPRKQEVTRVINLEFTLPRDPDKIVQILIFIGEIRNQPRLRLIRFPNAKVMIPLIHMSLGFPTRPDYAVHMK